MSKFHTPVMLNEVVKLLNIKPDHWYIDCNLGGGGHTQAILQSGGKVLGIDVDPDAIKETGRKLTALKLYDRTVLCQDNFIHLLELVKSHEVNPVAGILFDLGWASGQLGAVQGLSFKEGDEMLDMRFMGEGASASDTVNGLKEEELADIIYTYGEERYSRRIAKEIVEIRRRERIKTVGDLVRIIARAVPARYEGGRIHPATRTFQALRIYVNHELENIEKGLRAGIEVLKPGGKLVVISFHSLEDRIAKNLFRDEGKKGTLTVLTKKPLQATREEIRSNPRARSAKLRAAIKM